MSRRRKNTDSGRNPEYDVIGGDIPRHLFPQGRIRFSLGARGRTADMRRTKMDELRKDHEWEILKAIADRRIDIAEVERVLQRNGKSGCAELRERLQHKATKATPTLDEEIEGYLIEYKSMRRPLSYTNTASRLRRIADQSRQDTETSSSERLGGVPIDQIDSSDLESAISSISRSPNTHENLRSAASGLFKWSIRRERNAAKRQQRQPRWTENPVREVPSRKRPNRVRVLTDAEFASLLVAAEPYQEAYVRSFGQVGFREAELIHTRKGLDLNLESWRWTIQDHPPEPDCPCRPCRTTGWKPKGELSYRTVEIPEEMKGVREAVKQYLALNPVEQEEYLFRNPRTGRIWNARSLIADFKKLCKRAGVPYGQKVPNGVVIHDLRHTCATNLLRAGVDVATVAKILGDTVKTVLETYLNMAEDDVVRGLTAGAEYARRTVEGVVGTDQGSVGETEATEEVE